MPQAFGSSGAQLGIGSMLVLAAVATSLVWLEAEEVCVLATAPVRTRATTKARTMCFIVRFP